ncbi:protein FAM228A isoform X1 [Mobula birostris]|uniref:protein FAM228A isoform X1 n=1 Tax=Mobula birostris TaxID=1983395 RepID=UPI003B27D9F7
MGSRKGGAGRITVHRPFPSESPAGAPRQEEDFPTQQAVPLRAESSEIDTATCSMKSPLSQKCARIQSLEKCHNASKEQQCVNWLSKKYFTHLQTKAVLESNEVYTLCQPIYDTHESFVKELDKYLAYKDMLNLRKKELLYKKWNECVYQPLQWKLRSILNQSLEKRRASILQYLDYCSKKEPVFLENYNADDFNPFVLQQCKPKTLKARALSLNDPLLLQSRSKSEEDSAILQCQEGKVYSLKQRKEFLQPQLPLVPLDRHKINCITWLRIPLSYIESDVRQRSRKRIISETARI